MSPDGDDTKKVIPGSNDHKKETDIDDTKINLDSTSNAVPSSSSNKKVVHTDVGNTKTNHCGSHKPSVEVQKCK